MTSTENRCSAVSRHALAIPREPAEAMSTTWFDPVATLGFLAARTRSARG